MYRLVLRFSHLSQWYLCWVFLCCQIGLISVFMRMLSLFFPLGAGHFPCFCFPVLWSSHLPLLSPTCPQLWEHKHFQYSEFTGQSELTSPQTQPNPQLSLSLRVVPILALGPTHLISCLSRGPCTLPPQPLPSLSPWLSPSVLASTSAFDPPLVLGSPQPLASLDSCPASTLVPSPPPQHWCSAAILCLSYFF